MPPSIALCVRVRAGEKKIKSLRLARSIETRASSVRLNVISITVLCKRMHRGARIVVVVIYADVVRSSSRGTCAESLSCTARFTLKWKSLS
jgi:hypothetical protein